MIKKKTNRVGNLAVEYIRNNVINVNDFFAIFKPYVEFTKNHGDPNPTRVMDGGRIDIHEEYNNLLGYIKFIMNRGDAKKYNIRKFNVYQENSWGVWAYEWHKDGVYQKSDIFFSTNFALRVYDNLAMYHFLREMKKVVPNCLIEIEKLMFARL